MTKKSVYPLLLSAILLLTVASCMLPLLKSGGDKAGLVPATVVRISDEYANINTDVSQVDLSVHGITHGTVFTVSFRDRTLTVLLGEDYSDVSRGEWVGLIEDDGNLQLAISFGNAATDLGCSVGDTLYIVPAGSE